jgi:aspartyl/glutamyl-tRNA(Asn/Gln) amidotransferase C subunit
MQLHIVTNKIHNITRILFMALDISDIKRIAHLARLQISEQEATQTLTKLTGILALIEQMQAVDTAGITPMSHSQDVVQICVRLFKPMHQKLAMAQMKKR